VSLYDAFISYSHAKDKLVGAALQSVIQKLGKPWYKRRALRVFRDDTSLAATPELWPSIEQALGQSRYMIVLASPQVAASRWCGLEVAYWLEHKSLDTLLIALTEGELLWDNATHDFVWNETTPLPVALKDRFRNEPKWIDLRAYREAPNPRDAKFIDAGADLAAAVHGQPKEDLLSQEVKQQRRALRLAWSAFGALLILTAGVGWQWLEADKAKRLAQAQRDRAEKNFMLVKTSARVLATEVARHMRSARVPPQILQRILEPTKYLMDQLANSEPDDEILQHTRLQMLWQFSHTYEAQGDITRAREAADESLAIARKLAGLGQMSPLQVSGSLMRVADLQRAIGDRAGALAAYRESVEIGRKHLAGEQAGSSLLIGLATGLQKLSLVADNHVEARAALREAAAILEGFPPERKRMPAQQALIQTINDQLAKLGPEGHGEPGILKPATSP